MKKIDPFLILMLLAVTLATFFPATGGVAHTVDLLGTIGVGLLFFGHGAVLSPGQVLSGLKQWRLHLFIFATTFVFFPVIVQPLRLLPVSIMPPDLLLGFFYLAVLPSAVSTSIAYVAMARGNVAAAVCNSAGSNVFGLLLTPLLMSLFLSTAAAGAMDVGHAMQEVLLQLLLPFAAGQAIHPFVGTYLNKRKQWLNNYDRSVIVLIVYSAFSKSVTAGLWQELPLTGLVLAAGLCILILIACFAFTIFASRRLGFARGDEIAAVFCGSKKSLASGLPLAQVLFAGAPGFGMIVLPIMLYNQIQILIGVVLARRYANRAAPEKPSLPDTIASAA